MGLLFQRGILFRCCNGLDARDALQIQALGPKRFRDERYGLLQAHRYRGARFDRRPLHHCTHFLREYFDLGPRGGNKESVDRDRTLEIHDLHWKWG